jgi:Ricin-type beta-trefoil lectin domain/Cellulase (glycosyl hydrolase family 5)
MQLARHCATPVVLAAFVIAGCAVDTSLDDSSGESSAEALTDSSLYGEITGVDGRCLATWDGKVGLWSCNSSSSQRWRYNANGTITNLNGDCLHAEYGATDGTRVQSVKCDGSVAQQWVVAPGAGTVTNPHSGMCLDDKLARTENGNPVQVWTCLGNKQQHWNVSAGAVTAIAETGCTRATGPFTVDRTNVIDGNGRVFISYGATLSTPQYYPATYLENGTGETTLTETEAQIKAIAEGWCGNTVRLQIEQDVLVGVDGTTLNTAYLSFVQSIVSYAEQEGLAVVLNDQTEPGGATDTSLNEPLPTQATEAFWHQMNKLYARDPLVIYDLFNEPRAAVGSDEIATWNLWRDGGAFSYSYDGRTYSAPFIGMQALSDYVRQDGAKNLFWIETTGNRALDELSLHPDAYLIKGDEPLAYEYHHTTTGGVARTEANWDAQFGNLIKDGIAPVVDGEWTNYSTYTGWRASNGDSGECWADATKTVPQYLDYLQGLGVGMTVWTLAKGFMVAPSAPSGDYVTPSTFESNWSCTEGLGQGAGQLVQDWFKQQNGPSTK